MSSAATRGARGASVTILGQVLKSLIQFASTVVLSRLLAPDQFGLIAMVAVFVAFGETIRDFGMTLIGLQRKDLSDQEASNLFWINTALGLVTATTLAASAGLLVALYGEPRLWWLAPAIAPTLLLNGVAAQVRVQLSRSMRFALIASIDVAAQALVFTAGVVLAALGFGYWALAISSLLGSLAGLVGPWVATRWRPLRPRRDATSARLVRDGAAFGFAQFLTYLANNVDTMAIGMRWDPLSVGLYNRGYQLLTLPIQQLMGPLTQVVVPTVHRAVEEGRTVDSVLMRVQFGLGSVVIWMFGVSAATADWLIPFLLGDEWRPSVQIFQALAFGGFFWAFSQVNYWRVIIENHGRQLFYLNLVTKSITIAFIIFGSFISIQAVAWAVAAGLAATWPIALIWFKRVANWDSWQQFGNGMRLMVPGATATCLGLLVMQRLSGAPDLRSAVAAAATVTVVYLAGILVVPGGAKELRAVARMVRNMAPLRLG